MCWAESFGNYKNSNNIPVKSVLKDFSDERAENEVLLSSSRNLFLISQPGVEELYNV